MLTNLSFRWIWRNISEDLALLSTPPRERNLSQIPCFSLQGTSPDCSFDRSIRYRYRWNGRLCINGMWQWALRSGETGEVEGW